MFAFTTQRLHPSANPTAGERLLLLGVGGYGRGEMAPHSDVDIGFVMPGKQTGWSEQVIESMLYTLWDLRLKIGQSTRSLDEMIRQAKGDVTVRTALLEARYVAGDPALYADAQRRFKAEVQRGSERQFIADKLAESFKQPFIVDNRAGAGGTLGSDVVAKAPPDGYTMLLGTSSTHAIAATLYGKLPYNPVRDFAPVSLVGTATILLVVNPAVPARSPRGSAAAGRRPAGCRRGPRWAGPRCSAGRASRRRRTRRPPARAGRAG